MPKGNVICEVLGYKYRYFSDTKTPHSLYTITALLLQSNIIVLEDIYSWVSKIIILRILHFKFSISSSVVLLPFSYFKVY